MPVFCHSQVQIAFSTYALYHSFVYFLCKTKVADSRFVNVCHALLSCSVFVQINPHRTLYSKCSNCLVGLAVIQQRVQEEISI